MQRLILLLIFTLLLIKPTANAIFLSNAGVKSLPFAYLLVAVIALVFTLYYNRLLDKISSVSIFSKSIKVCIVLLVLIGLILNTGGFEVIGAYIFYLFVSIFGILTASQFWILANQIFDAREARKYFGIIGFGAIAGGISGGYLASVISSLFSSGIIPFVAAFVLIFVLKIIDRFRHYDKGDLLLETKSELQTSSKVELKEPFRLIRKSKYLTFLAIVILVNVFTSKLIDFQFGYFATKTFSSSEELTAFYGVMYSTFNLVAIMIQLFLTTRVIGRFGVGYSILILPTILFFNAGLIFIIPGLLLAGSLKLFEASLKQSINKAAFELIMLPVPQDLKLRTKTFLDVFIDSLATGLSGIVLILVLQALEFPEWVVNLIILFSILIWIYLDNKIRKEYLVVFRSSLNIQKETVEDPETIEKSYRKILNSGGDFQIMKTLNLLSHNPLPGLELDYVKLLEHKNPRIVKEAIQSLMYLKSDYAGLISPLLNHKSQNVQVAAFEYLINHQHGFEPDYLISKIQSEDLEEKVIALTAYSREFKNDPRTLKMLRIEDRIEDVLSRFSKDNDETKRLLSGLLKAIGYGKFTGLYPIIEEHLYSGDNMLYPQAVLAAGESQSSIFLKILINLLDSKERPKPYLIEALSKFSTKRLENAVASEFKKMGSHILTYISTVLELKADQNSISFLNRLMEHSDVNIRHNAIHSLRVLNDRFPLLQVDMQLVYEILIEECKYTNEVLSVVLSMLNNQEHRNEKEESDGVHKLIKLLRQEINTNLYVIFQLLHIYHPTENYIEIINLIREGSEDLRNNAIEYVDNSLSLELKAEIVPLLEFVSNHVISRSNLADKLSGKKIRLFLVNNRDMQIQNAAMDYYGMHDL